MNGFGFWKTSGYEKLLSFDHINHDSDSEECREHDLFYRFRASQTQFYRSRRLLVISFTLNVIAVFALLSPRFTLRFFQHDPPTWTGPWAGAAPAELAEPYPHELKQAPDFGMETTVFEENKRFMGVSADVDEQWDSMWPSNSPTSEPTLANSLTTTA